MSFLYAITGKTEIDPKIQASLKKISTESKKIIEECAACHGLDGNSSMRDTPDLAGQHIDYIIKQLQDIQQSSDPKMPNNRTRKIPVMTGMLNNVNKSNMIEIAHYYANQTQSKRRVSGSKSLAKLGEAIYMGGNTTNNRPPCSGCHGFYGLGLSKMPRLQGLDKQYIIKQLYDFQKNMRTNDITKAMPAIAKKLTPQEIEAVSDYIQGIQNPNKIDQATIISNTLK
ncbi:MAG: c-type cytochrome [Endozoicomonadaceae bacterium]|nr:c-type cytochrome [Endozoicomonadaceae bacterium]